MFTTKNLRDSVFGVWAWEIIWENYPFVFHKTIVAVEIPVLVLHTIEKFGPELDEVKSFISDFVCQGFYVE